MMIFPVWIAGLIFPVRVTRRAGMVLPMAASIDRSNYDGRVSNHAWRIETPAKRAVESSIWRHPGPAVKSIVPEPTGTIETRITENAPAAAKAVCGNCLGALIR